MEMCCVKCWSLFRNINVVIQLSIPVLYIQRTSRLHGVGKSSHAATIKGKTSLKISTYASIRNSILHNFCKTKEVINKSI